MILFQQVVVDLSSSLKLLINEHACLAFLDYPSYFNFNVTNKKKYSVPCPLFWSSCLLGSTEYSNSLVNADSFYANFNNKTFQKIHIPHLTNTMKQNFPLLMRITNFFINIFPLTCLMQFLVNVTFSKNQK